MKIVLLSSLFGFLYIVCAQNLGALYFNGNCITCHHPTKSISAPSASALQRRYKDAFKEKEEFVAYMTSWVYKPTQEGSLMDDAIKKYGLMPELALDKETLEIIGRYIYETDFEKEGIKYWIK